ncbi:hypothetical protein V6N12_028796 [Hibiscus sabdariffa]|uniref:Uncharacterized protein n=1 Tax=Hibiscus sabdariffa TaxID=183260 RepID=A0ABR2F6U7_9ROSI
MKIFMAAANKRVRKLVSEGNLERECVLHIAKRTRLDVADMAAATDHPVIRQYFDKLIARIDEICADANFPKTDLSALCAQLAECFAKSNDEMKCAFWDERVYDFCRLLDRLSAEMRLIEFSYQLRGSRALHYRLYTLTKQIHGLSADKILYYSSICPLKEIMDATFAACIAEINNIYKYKIPLSLRQHLAQLSEGLAEARDMSISLNGRDFEILKAANFICRFMPFSILEFDKNRMIWAPVVQSTSTGGTDSYFPRLQSSQDSFPSRKDPKLEHREDKEANAAEDEDTGAQVLANAKLKEVITSEEDRDLNLDQKLKLFKFDKEGYESEEKGAVTAKLWKHKGESPLVMWQSKTPKIFTGSRQNPDGRGRTVNDPSNSCVSYDTGTVSSAGMALPENSPNSQRGFIDESSQHPNYNISTHSQGSAAPRPYHDSVSINVGHSAESYPQMSSASPQNPAVHVGAIQDRTVSTSSTHMALPGNSPDPQRQFIDKSNRHLNYAARSQTQRPRTSLNNQPDCDVANRDDETARHSTLFEILVPANFTNAREAAKMFALNFRSAGQPVFTRIFGILAVCFAFVAFLSSLAGLSLSNFWPNTLPFGCNPRVIRSMHIVAVHTTAYAFIGTIFHEFLQDEPLLMWIVSVLASVFFMAIMKFIGRRI